MRVGLSRKRKVLTPIETKNTTSLNRHIEETGTTSTAIANDVLNESESNSDAVKVDVVEEEEHNKKRTKRLSFKLKKLQG